MHRRKTPKFSVSRGGTGEWKVLSTDQDLMSTGEFRKIITRNDSSRDNNTGTFHGSEKNQSHVYKVSTDHEFLKLPDDYKSTPRSTISMQEIEPIRFDLKLKNSGSTEKEVEMHSRLSAQSQ